ncbi:MAG TPA: hypothetical protein VFW87_20230 [Pirellulales bacterium]|nr:hypothetical protein [Pirellulales bacterium]
MSRRLANLNATNRATGDAYLFAGGALDAHIIGAYDATLEAVGDLSGTAAPSHDLSAAAYGNLAVTTLHADGDITLLWTRGDCQRAVKSRPSGEMKSSHFEWSAIRQHFPSTRFRLMETADVESSQDGDCRSDTTPTFVTLVPTEDRQRTGNRPENRSAALGAAAKGANCRHFARRLRGVNCRPFAGVTGSR